MSDKTRNIWMIYSTFANREEALSVARALVDEHLVACVNIVDHVTSVYRWENAIEEGSEVIMLAKTSQPLVAPATERIIALHDYDIPCVTSWELEKGNADFFKWVESETASR